jgi:hypothetical protein
LSSFARLIRTASDSQLQEQCPLIASHITPA